MVNEINLKGFYNMDCMDALPDIPDKYFDLAIIDPPYRKASENQPTIDMRNNNAGTMKNFGDKPGQDYFEQLFRVSKEQIIFGANNFTLPEHKGFVIWDKTNVPENFTMSQAEYAFISDGLGTISKIYRGSANRGGHGIHPTQKPVALYRWLLNLYAKPGDVILDTHVGSGSSLIAFEETGHDYLGFEINKEYYDAAVQRLEDFNAQIRMELL